MAAMSGAGYSGTPLSKKLGIRDGDRVAILNDPGQAVALVSPLPAAASRTDDPADADVVLFFTKARDELESQVAGLGEAIFPDRSLWVAWPKRASGVATDLTENVVREITLPLGLVDTKVCAVDETWSGLRLVWRRERRSRA
jgi:hypothetical protein